MVEHLLAKERVAGSNPVFRSRTSNVAPLRGGFLCRAVDSALEGQMAVLCVTSLTQGEGKTALSSGLARLLIGQGRAVHAFNPLRVSGNDDAGRDSAFLASLTGATPPADWPLTVSDGNLSPDTAQAISNASTPDHDTIIEAPALDEGTDAAPLVQSLASALDARVLLVARYSPDLTAERIMEAAAGFGDRLAGVVINRVFKYRTQDAQAGLAEALRSQDIPVLALLPEDRRLQAVTVDRIAEHLNGEYFLGQDKKDQLFDNVLIGGIVLDNGVEYFGISHTKAVLVRADRPDIQMAALQTPTRCLVLTGGHRPIQYIEHEAREEEVPVILVQQGTLEASRQLDTLFEEATIHYPDKADAFADLLQSHADSEALGQAVGLQQ